MSKKKKIMTISDLYKFCIKNNFCHFSSSTNNEEICVQMPAIFEKEENVELKEYDNFQGSNIIWQD
jgi:hypothetical protein